MSSNIQECAICLEPIGQLFIQLPCGHVFDYHCISNWFRKGLETSDSQTCPLDRISFSLQQMKKALFQFPEGKAFRELMANYDHYHNISVENQLKGKAREENEKNRQATYAKVNVFVEAHPEFMDFLPLNWF